MMISAADIEALRPSMQQGPAMDTGVTGVSTDSRTTGRGELFVALRGERFDGHAFVGEAFRRGARAVIVHAVPDMNIPPDATLIVVPDTLRALGTLAARYRGRFRIPVVAIAGSSGKTTTKEMTAAVLRGRYRILSSEASFNNEIGVPLTLFRLTREHQVAVIELGTNHPGEIARLCRIAAPTHGLLTNIGREHLEFFGTLAGVTREEGDLFRAVAAGGSAVVNADDARVVRLGRGVRRRVTYGFESRAAVKGRELTLDENGCARFVLRPGMGRKSTAIRLSVPGKHNAANALAAAAVGVALNVPVRAIRAALETFEPVAKRMQVTRAAGIVVLDDTYNANPDSVAAALSTLASLRTEGKRIAVLADMKELGNHTAREHKRVCKTAARLGIDYLLTFGEAMRENMLEPGRMVTLRYDQKNMLAEELAELVAPGDAVLVKGSRSMRMEDVVVFLLERLRSERR